MVIRFMINEKEVEVDVNPSELLIEVIREKLGLTGVKESCSLGNCGACTVLLNGKPVNSCLILAAEVEGATILTVEGLAKNGLSSLQEAFHKEGAVQCGFCTPGTMMTLTALLETDKHPTEEQIRKALEGNLCRCTGYGRIVNAVKSVTKATNNQ